MAALAITGVSEFLGQALLREVVAASPRSRVVGLDVRHPRFAPPQLAFYLQTDPDELTQVMQRERVRQVVHLSFPVFTLRDDRLTHRLVVDGTRSLLQACASAGVEQVVVVSSTAVYGPRDEMEVPVDEDASLRGHPRLAFARDKLKVEWLCREFAVQHPKISLTILRPAPVMGPGTNSLLARLLADVPILPRTKASEPSLQLLHVDDMVRALCLVLERRLAGTFNVVPRSPIGFERVAEVLGKRVVWIPALLLYPGWELLYQLRLPWVQTPSAVLDYLYFPWLADGERARDRLGFRSRYDSEAALRASLGGAA